LLHSDAQLFLWPQPVSRNDVRFPAKEDRKVKLVGHTEWQNRVAETTLILTNHSTTVWSAGACPVCTACVVRCLLKQAVQIFGRLQFVIAVLMLVKMPIFWERATVADCYIFLSVTHIVNILTINISANKCT
jgi:hypothetical protein